MKPSHEPYYDKLVELNREYYDYHVQHILWTPKWWLLVVITIVPWLIWYGLRGRRTAVLPAILAVLPMMLVSTALDNVGILCGLWAYPVKIFPMLEMFIPWSWTLLPITALFLLQYKLNQWMWTKALLFGLIASYIGEPIAVWLNLYEMKNWSYHYSVPIYTVIFIGVFRIYKGVMKLTSAHEA